MRRNPDFFRGKTIVVTGATRGIGRALCHQLFAQGAQVIGVARNQSQLTAMHNSHPAQFTPQVCDLADPDDRAALRAALPVQLDGLINNAGVQFETNYFDMAPTRTELEIAINLTAPVALITDIIPRLRAAENPFIVNVSSGLAFTPKQAAPLYSATKAALHSFTTGLRYQSQAHCPHMTVSEAVLPMVDTDMTAGRGTGKITPDKAAGDILVGVANGAPMIWIGKARMLPWLWRISPAIVVRMLR